MISLTVDMVQYDCPYIDVTESHDVSFFAKHWDFNPAERELETRILVRGSDRPAVDNGLDALRSHDRMEKFTLLSRKDNRALIRTMIGETNAMKVVRDHEGYITGPFEIAEGSEHWHIGFDTERVVSDALSDLDRRNDFSVISDRAVDIEDYYDLVSHADAAKGLLDSCRELSEVERSTLQAAVEVGYFSTPRDATLQTLAERFDVSKTAVSKNLRRAEEKVFDRVVSAMDDIED